MSDCNEYTHTNDPNEELIAPSILGPAIAHCGQWHEINSLPWQCPKCDELLGLCMEKEEMGY
jgi:hypothetical protein